MTNGHANHQETATPQPVGCRSDRGNVARKCWSVAWVVVLVVGLTTAFVLASDVFFLFFASVLLAILLRAAMDALCRWTGLGSGFSLAIVVILLVTASGCGLYLIGAPIAGQVSQLAANLPDSVEQAQQFLRGQTWGQELLLRVPSIDSILSNRMGDVAIRAQTFFTTTLGAAGNLLVLFALGFYLAASPEKYVNCFMALVPKRRRIRVQEVAHAVVLHLRWWMIGRFIAMIFVGVVVALGLWMVGVSQFLVLGLLAGALTVIPFFGPILAAVPGVLLALVQGPSTAVWAVAVYVLAQAVENYLITPLVQQETVNLPPAVAIAAVTLAGALFGVIALVVASPLAVAVMVIVKMLYVEDVLDEEMGVSGVRSKS